MPREQRARALYVVLGASWQALAAPVRRTLARVARLQLVSLPAEEVLTVFLALRRARRNHKHTARAIVRFLLEHPSAEALARARRQAVRDALEHAVGRDTLRGALKKEGTAIPFVRDRARAAALLAGLYEEGGASALAADGAELTLAQAHEAYARAVGDAPREAPRTITSTNRGDVSATLVHMYQGGATPELRRALAGYVERAAAELPRFSGRLAIVLDASASTRGYGEREYACVAQSVALSLVLARVCRDLRVVTVSGSLEDPPRPEGATDLASAVLDAAASSPDVIAVVTDGYENVHDGDLAAVARALPEAGVAAPVVVCHSKFTFKDDLTLRRPAPALPELELWHEDDFGDVLFGLASRARSDLAASFLRGALEARLARFEKESKPWLIAP